MKTRAELLAQLEAEQASGDPTWDRGRNRSAAQILARLEFEQELGDTTGWHDIYAEVVPLRTIPTMVRIHPRARRAA